MISTVDVLRVVGAFVNEDDYTVWSDLTGNLGQISILLQNTDGYNSYKAFSRKLYKPVAQSLGWEAKDKEGKLCLFVCLFVCENFFNHINKRCQYCHRSAANFDLCSALMNMPNDCPQTSVYNSQDSWYSHLLWKLLAVKLSQPVLTT